LFDLEGQIKPSAIGLVDPNLIVVWPDVVFTAPSGYNRGDGAKYSMSCWGSSPGFGYFAATCLGQRCTSRRYPRSTRVMRSMDSIFWAYSRHSHLQSSHIEAPVRSATSNLNQEPDSHGQEEPSTLRLNQDFGKGARFQCDRQET
jgi:hypothetical protein